MSQSRLAHRLCQFGLSCAAGIDCSDDPAERAGIAGSHLAQAGKGHA
jgi:hypothetical protein